MSNARREVLDIADALLREAADCHAEGMTLAEASARVRQLASIANDEQLEAFLEDMKAEGLDHLKSGTVDIKITGRGGQS